MGVLLHRKLPVDTFKKMREEPGEILEGLLEDRQKTKVWLAEKLGVSHSFVHHLLRGRKEINLSTLEKIRVHLELTHDEYAELLRAISSRLDGVSSIISMVGSEYFEGILVPFAQGCFQRVQGVDEIHVQRSELLQCPLWKGSAILKSRSFNFDLRVFIGILEPGQIHFSWRNAGLRTAPPQKALLQVPIIPKPKDLHRLEYELSMMRTGILRTVSHGVQRQKVYVKNS